MLKLFENKISRKTFIKVCISGLASLPLYNSVLRPLFAQSLTSNGRPKKGIKGYCDLVVAKGEDPYTMTMKAVEAIGGMGRFVKKGGVVVIKPNIGWDRTPEQAGNTNPQVVAALVELCFKAGAKRVNVFDIPCNDARRCYANSGIETAAKEKGASVYFAETWDTLNARFNYQSPMQNWPILRDAIECDTFINVPILKHHGLTNLTLSMKNLMGVCGGSRGVIHQGIGRKLVDLTDFINPDLTIIDAYRILVRNGPTGGDLNDVVYKKTILVSCDPTLADLYACSLAGVDPATVSYLREALSRNFGITEVTKANIKQLEA